MKFNVPDLRGYFLRGVSGTSGRDQEADARTKLKPGGNDKNNVGSAQPSAYSDHSHQISPHGYDIIFTPNTSSVVGGINKFSIKATTGYSDQVTNYFGTGEIVLGDEAQAKISNEVSKNDSLSQIGAQNN